MLGNMRDYKRCEMRNINMNSNVMKRLGVVIVSVMLLFTISFNATIPVIAETVATATKTKVDVSKMLLVNAKNPIPKTFEANLEKIDKSGYYFDKKAVPALREMVAGAAKDKIFLTYVSTYRSNKRQANNFNNKVAYYKNLGYSEKKAITETAKYIAYPNTSEHTLGLAVDFNSLYTSFDKTKEYKWLVKNCAKYGFILRYPKDKVSITKINYEPWHYRYVGTTHAKAIMKEGICLEEYIKKHTPKNTTK